MSMKHSCFDLSSRSAVDIFPLLRAAQYEAALWKKAGVQLSCHKMMFLTLFAEPMRNVNQKLGLLFDISLYG